MEKYEKLSIALGIELNMQVEGMEEKFRATLIGIETPTYLMVRMQVPTRLDVRYIKVRLSWSGMFIWAIYMASEQNHLDRSRNLTK